MYLVKNNGGVLLMRKKNIQLVILFMLAVICMPSGLKGQEYEVSGKVTTYDSIPLIDAEIKAKGTGMEVKTDSLGRFTVNCLEDDKLTVRARGFRRERVKVNMDETDLHINLVLKDDPRSLELALGPDGHIREADKQKVSTINDKEVDFSMYSNIYDALRGRVAGVNIVGNIVYIRGQTTIGSGDAEALFVVDGIIVSKEVFSTIPTSDIQNIRVLKGSAAAIYGSRGGNGVVEVDTKRGKYK